MKKKERAAMVRAHIAHKRAKWEAWCKHFKQDPNEIESDEVERWAEPESSFVAGWTAAMQWNRTHST